MFGGYISQGVLQSNQQKTVQSSPNLLRKVGDSKTPGDSVVFSGVESDDMIFCMKKPGFLEEANKEIKESLETPVDTGFILNTQKTGSIKIEHTEGLISDVSNLSVKVGLDCDKSHGITTAFLCGKEGEIPSAEAAILTAQTIIEHDLAEKGKDRYTTLKECPQSIKIISVTEGFDNSMADIVVKNEPIFVDS
ncbi:MAG TPA: hypothetical protein PL110_09850 [Candidatus Eremiobacteraeota bacterium]|nr:MAG: hypothetical protein BWY64_02473 [bacterium ADurb.Bin363]HPZ08406.1 hypothetical protein [Candidatus Eremiobacteraeota bacterium]